VKGSLSDVLHWVDEPVAQNVLEWAGELVNTSMKNIDPPTSLTCEWRE